MMQRRPTVPGQICCIQEVEIRARQNSATNIHVPSEKLPIQVHQALDNSSQCLFFFATASFRPSVIECARKRSTSSRYNGSGLSCPLIVTFAMDGWHACGQERKHVSRCPPRLSFREDLLPLHGAGQAIAVSVGAASLLGARVREEGSGNWEAYVLFTENAPAA